MSTRQYARLLSDWLVRVGLDPHLYGTHSLRRTKATLIYRRTGNLRAVQLLLGHTKIESTVRYLGIELTTPSPYPSRLTFKLPGQGGDALPIKSLDMSVTSAISVVGDRRMQTLIVGKCQYPYGGSEPA
jgi:hypothetical protein